MRSVLKPSRLLQFDAGARTGVLIRLLIVAALVGLFAVACGGNGDDEDTPDAPATTGAAGATGDTRSTGPAAPTAASEAPANTGGTGGTGAIGSTGATESTGATGATGSGGGPEIAGYGNLKSFRWDVTLSGAGSFLDSVGIPSVPGDGETSEFTATGAFIAPDQAQVEINVAGFAYKQTIKGNEQWTSIAGVNTGPVPATDSAESLIYVSAFVDPSSMAGGASMDCGGAESVNGVQAVRCETTDEVNAQIVEQLAGSGAEASEASFVLWIAEEGNYVVRYDFSATGTANGEPFEWNFVANITDVNNVGSIEP